MNDGTSKRPPEQIRALPWGVGPPEYEHVGQRTRMARCSFGPSKGSPGSSTRKTRISDVGSPDYPPSYPANHCVEPNSVCGIESVLLDGKESRTEAGVGDPDDGGRTSSRSEKESTHVFPGCECVRLSLGQEAGHTNDWDGLRSPPLRNGSVILGKSRAAAKRRGFSAKGKQKQKQKQKQARCRTAAWRARARALVWVRMDGLAWGG
jgi:hypothetical protein